MSETLGVIVRWLWLVLIALHLFWFGILTPADSLGRAGTAILVTSPLLVMLAWMWPPGPKVRVIGGMLLLLYFCLGVAEAWATSLAPVRLVALIQIALIAAYYVVLFKGWRRARGAR